MASGTIGRLCHQETGYNYIYIYYNYIYIGSQVMGSLYSSEVDVEVENTSHPIEALQSFCLSFCFMLLSSMAFSAVGVVISCP